MNVERFQETLMSINKFGLSERGMNRLAYTEAEQNAVHYMIGLFKQEGMEVNTDAVGNVIAKREGLNPELPAVACGSHIDTVYNGGKYDGTIGVLAGLELVRHLNEYDIKTEHPIEVIIFACEESARFGAATIGSKAMTGLLRGADVESLVDKDGIKLYEALTKCGFNPKHLSTAKRGSDELKAFYELHIEQGPVLEESSTPIGIVTGIAAPTRFNLIINGQAAHSGTTPMNYRKDAFLGATEIALALENAVQTETKFGTVVTIGECIVTPGAMNVVPEKAELKIDIRSTSELSKQRMKQHLLQTIEQVSKKRDLSISTIELCDDRPVEMDEDCIQAIKDSCEELNLTYVEMASGAGHDTMNIALLCPVGMVFVPSENGLSHNKAEYTPVEKIMKGVQVLIDIMMKESLVQPQPILKE